MTWCYTNTFTFPAPPERVFRAWTDPGELTRRVAERAEVTLAPGGAYRFWGKHTVGGPTAAEATQTLARIEPNRRLAFTWTLYQTGGEVSVDLEPGGERTRVSFVHAGFERTADLSDYPFGWAGFLEGFVQAAEALVQR